MKPHIRDVAHIIRTDWSKSTPWALCYKGRVWPFSLFGSAINRAADRFCGEMPQDFHEQLRDIEYSRWGGIVPKCPGVRRGCSKEYHQYSSIRSDNCLLWDLGEDFHQLRKLRLLLRRAIRAYASDKNHALLMEHYPHLLEVTQCQTKKSLVAS